MDNSQLTRDPENTLPIVKAPRPVARQDLRAYKQQLIALIDSWIDFCRDLRADHLVGRHDYDREKFITLAGQMLWIASHTLFTSEFTYVQHYLVRAEAALQAMAGEGWTTDESLHRSVLRFREAEDHFCRAVESLVGLAA